MNKLIETQIIDGILPQTYADEIERTLFNMSFPWYLLEDITYSNTPQFKMLKPDEMNPGFMHYLLYENNESTYFNFFKVIPHLALAKKFNYNQSRCFLQLPSNKQQKQNNIHTDNSFPHIVCLYYVNDSDGDTILFSEDRKTIIKTISPKKNRVVIFDGSIPHASSKPTIGKRAVINYNLTT